MSNKNLGKRAVDQFTGSAEDVSMNASYKKQRRDSSGIAATPSQWQFHQEKGLSSVEETSTTTTTICTNTKCYGKKIPIHFFKTKRSNSVSQMWSPASTSTSPATNSEMGSIQGGGETDAFRLSPRIAATATVTPSPVLSPSEDKPPFRYLSEDTWINIFLEILQADQAMKFQIAELQQQVAVLQEENQLLKQLSLQ